MSDDANPDDQTTIVNIKDVRKNIWKGAKELADKRKEVMGSLVSRALDQLIRVEEAGPGAVLDIIPANLVPKNETVKLIPKSANPEDLSTIELLRVGATYQDLKAVPGLRSLLAERVRVARGLPLPSSRERRPPVKRLAAPSGAGEGTDD